MLTLETQLNSSVLNQNGALWLGDWDPRSPQARLTASCCSALDLWQQTKVLFLFCSAFINPQMSTPPLWQKLVLFFFLALNWMRAHLKRRSSTFLRVCRHLLERMLRRVDVYKTSVLGLGELIWIKKTCVAVIVDILGSCAILGTPKPPPVFQKIWGDRSDQVGYIFLLHSWGSLPEPTSTFNS